MAASIGSGSLVLTTNATGMLSGLKAASDKAKKMAGDMQQGVSGKLSGMFKGGLALGAGMAVFDAVKSGITSVIGMFNDLKDKIDETAKNARRFGMDTQTMGGLEHAAGLSGVKVEELRAAMQKMAARGENIFQFAERLERMNPAQARQALNELGEQGYRLRTLFEGGAAGLRQMVEEGRRFTLSDQEAAKVEAANDAISRMKLSLEFLKSKVVVALAPAFERVGNFLKTAFEKAQPAVEWLIRNFHNIMLVISPAYRAITLLVKILTGVWERIRGQVQPVIDWIVEAWETATMVIEAVWDEVVSVVVDLITQVVDWISNAITSVIEWGKEVGILGNTFMSARDLILMVFRAIGKAGAYVWDTIKAGVGAVAIAIGFIVEKVFTRLVDAFHSVASLAKELPDSIRPTWVNSFVDGVGRARDAVHAGGVGMQRWGREQINAWGSSAAAVDRWFDNLGSRRAEAAAAERARIEEIASKPVEYKAVAAMTKGSKEAWSVEARFRTEGMLNPQLDAQQRQLQEAQRANQILREVRDAVQNITLPILNVF